MLCRLHSHSRAIQLFIHLFQCNLVIRFDSDRAISLLFIFCRRCFGFDKHSFSFKKIFFRRRYARCRCLLMAIEMKWNRQRPLCVKLSNATIASSCFYRECVVWEWVVTCHIRGGYVMVALTRRWIYWYSRSFRSICNRLIKIKQCAFKTIRCNSNSMSPATRFQFLCALTMNVSVEYINYFTFNSRAVNFQSQTKM